MSSGSSAAIVGSANGWQLSYLDLPISDGSLDGFSNSPQGSRAAEVAHPAEALPNDGPPPGSQDRVETPARLLAQLYFDCQPLGVKNEIGSMESTIGKLRRVDPFSLSAFSGSQLALAQHRLAAAL
jgi:hypothetical protein